MIEFRGKIKDCVKTFKGDYIFTLTTSQKDIPEEAITELEEADIKVEIKKYKEKRSMSANAYCWVLCDKIAEKIKSTKENVYREIVKRVGVFDIFPIRNDALQTFIKRWQYNGIGWICEVMRESKLPNYTNVMAYYGSSTYDTAEMSRLIDEIVQEAKSLGIQTETPEQIQNMLSLMEEVK